MGRPLPDEPGGDGLDRPEPVRRQQAGRRRGRSRSTASTASTCATSARPSSCSRRGATTSRRRSRRSTGSPICTDSVDDIRLNDQTIVYCLHEKIGHLGIFVSAGVAKRETSELASALELIDTLPPGLYEAIIEDTHPDMPGQRVRRGPLPDPVRAAHHRRHPGPRRRPGRRAGVRGGRARVARSTRASTTRSSRRS